METLRGSGQIARCRLSDPNPPRRKSGGSGARARSIPRLPGYTEVYHRAGLLGPRTILGHCIYLDDDELAMIKSADAAIAHCPTANEALGSGRMPMSASEKLVFAGRWPATSAQGRA